MASVNRRVKRLLAGKSKSAPSFTERELGRLKVSTRKKVEEALAILNPAPTAAPAPEPEPIKEPETVPVVEVKAPGVEVKAPTAEVKAPGTYAVLKDGTEYGPYKNQNEARSAVRETLGVPRLPAGTTFTRV
jgi:hypothetical protein